MDKSKVLSFAGLYNKPYAYRKWDKGLVPHPHQGLMSLFWNIVFSIKFTQDLY